MQTPLWHADKNRVVEGRELVPLEVPMMSLAERDRRWAAIREKMFLRGLDALVIVGTDSVSSTGMANVRYVTQLAPIVGALVVFPLVGEPIVYWGAPQMHVPVEPSVHITGRWVDDVRSGGGVASAVAALSERGLGDTRIGVVGYRHMLAPLSDVPAAIMSGLAKALPHTDIADHTSLLDELRLIKSEEEKAFLRRAGEIACQRIDRMIATAEPGNTEAEVWAAMEHEAIINGGEPGTFNLLSSGPVNEHTNRVVSLIHGAVPPHTPTQRLLAEGDLIVCEFHTSYGGYQAHTEFSIFIGDAPPELNALHDVAMDIERMAEGLFVPDRPLRNINTAFQDYAESYGFDFVELGCHGHGLSSPEFPTSIFRAADNDGFVGRGGLGGVRLRENMVFGLNIDIHNPGWRRDVGVQFGGTVAVGSGGAEYLCDIPHDVFEVPIQHQGAVNS